MTNRSRIPSRCAGFTLVELLVVIAIITILAVMMLPVLRSALETSRTVTCMNTQKQITFGIWQFADDNRGRGPGGGHAANGSRTWQNVLNLTVFPKPPQVPRGGGVPSKKDFSCPSIYRPEVSSTIRQWAMNENLLSGLSIADAQLFPYDGYVWDEYHLGFNLKTIQRPSIVILMADHERGCDRVANWSMSNIDDLAHPYNRSGGMFTFRHNKPQLRMNFFFVDGHGRTLGPDSDMEASEHYSVP